MTSQLKDLLRARGITPRRAVRETGLSWRIIYGLVHDRDVALTQSQIATLCTYLNCTPGDIYHAVPDEGPE